MRGASQSWEEGHISRAKARPAAWLLRPQRTIGSHALLLSSSFHLDSECVYVFIRKLTVLHYIHTCSPEDPPDSGEAACREVWYFPETPLPAQPSTHTQVPLYTVPSKGKLRNTAQKSMLGLR